MRKIFTLVIMCMLATMAWGETTITFIAGQTVGNEKEKVQGPDEMSLDGITISSTYAAFGTAQYRMGKGSTTTITSTIGNIVKVEFTCTKDYPATGFSEPAGVDDAVWEGNAQSINFVAGNKQVRATQIAVTVAEDGLAKPSFSHAGRTYYEPIQVAITCSTTGAKIYYTIDGNDPTTASTLYTAPIAINKNTTLKAISALNGEVSGVVSADYVIANPVAVDNIAEYMALADNTAVKFNNSVTALAQNKGYLYVMDNTGYALFYGDCGQQYTRGDVIPTGFFGTKTTYAGEPELQYLNNFKEASNKVTVNIPEIAANEVGHDRFAQLVQMNGVTFSVDAEGKNYTLTDQNGKTCAVFFGNMGISAPSDLTAKYNVEGIVGTYNKNNEIIYQLLPTRVNKVIIGTLGLGDLENLEDDLENQVTMAYDATVIGQSGKYLYLMDETGYGLVYGTVNKTYKQGDVIPAGYMGLKKTWDMEPELTDDNGKIALAGFESPIYNVGEPEAIPIASLNEVNHDNWGKYVKIKVKVSGSNLVDEQDNTIGYYKRFDCVYPAEGDDFCWVYAIVGSYKTNYQLLPYRFEINVVPKTVNSIAELYNLPENSYGVFATPLTAIYQNGSRTYVKDVNGKVTLVYGKLTEKLVNGDYINGATATWTLYPKTNGYKQMVPVDSTFIKAGHGAAVQPVVKKIEDVSQNDVHAYLKLENLKITATDEELKFNMMDEDEEEILLFNQFGITLPELDPNKTYTVEGFLTIYNNEREIFPIKVSEPFIKGDVNGDGVVNISDINVLITIILGANLDSGTMMRADVNGDNSRNIGDINEVIAIILK